LRSGNARRVAYYVMRACSILLLRDKGKYVLRSERLYADVLMLQLIQNKEPATRVQLTNHRCWPAGKVHPDNDGQCGDRLQLVLSYVEVLNERMLVNSLTVKRLTILIADILAHPLWGVRLDQICVVLRGQILQPISFWTDGRGLNEVLPVRRHLFLKKWIPR